MAYKIAVASSDGINIDLSFGAADTFDIYEAEGMVFRLTEKRKYMPEQSAGCMVGDGWETKKGCGSGSGCGSAGLGCSGGSSLKVQLISDCRCVVCRKIGFQINRELEKLAVTGFDVDCTAKEALTKITAYLDKIDNHQSLRGIQK